MSRMGHSGSMIQRVTRVLLAGIIGLALLAGGIWVLIHSLGEREPLYDGKSIFYWQSQMNNPASSVSNQARVVLQTQVVPRLTQVIVHDTQDSSLRLALIEQLNKLPGVTIYFTPAPGRRAQAASALGNLRSHAQGAVADR